MRLIKTAPESGTGGHLCKLAFVPPDDKKEPMIVSVHLDELPTVGRFVLVPTQGLEWEDSVFIVQDVRIYYHWSGSPWIMSYLSCVSRLTEAP